MSPVIPTKFMTILAWLTLVIACIAFVQASATITNAIEVHKRRKVAERQLELDREKFEYRKQLDENNKSGRLEAEDEMQRMCDPI